MLPENGHCDSLDMMPPIRVCHGSAGTLSIKAEPRFDRVIRIETCRQELSTWPALTPAAKAAGKALGQAACLRNSSIARTDLSQALHPGWGSRARSVRESGRSHAG